MRKIRGDHQSALGLMVCFLWPEREWENKGMTGYTTVANALVPFKGKWHLCRGGADTVIGLATCPMEK
jgi:predicted GH43/DUF377 family glycosyl hydrolase